VTICRIALANIPYPTGPEDSVARVLDAVSRAGSERAAIVCFPEAYVPGYRRKSVPAPPPDAAFLERAWDRVAAAAAKASVAVVLGTERVAAEGLMITALVIDRDGKRLGFQDKVQLDPSEDGLYVPARSTERHVFQTGPLKFGIAICHEGWRYPETVRSPARQGAHLVFHPHYHWAEPGDFNPTSFADPRNTFHEKAALCRAAENTCWFATVNYASDGSPTTSAVVRPDGTVLKWQPYGMDGVLVADIELEAATGVLAGRWRDSQS
jgi:predicted amidohydrolase